MELFATICPDCRSMELKPHTLCLTQNHGQRTIYHCRECGGYFSGTVNTFLAGLRKPLSFIVKVIKSRTGGLGLNAVCRSPDAAKNTVLNRENRFTEIKRVLLLYALIHTCLQLIVEGDEVYTRVGKNLPPDESAGWTIVLMDRASRFLREPECGRKDRNLFRKALRTPGRLIDRTGDFSLITDGERRYGNLLFEICHEVFHTGRKGRPRKTLRKGTKVRIRNKGSQSRKRGRKRPRYQSPCPEHPDTLQNIEDKDIHANHCEAFNSSLRRRSAGFRRRTNTYAKNQKGLQRTLDVYWAVHNFLRPHFTLKDVPAIVLGIPERKPSWKEIFMISLGDR